MIKRFFEGGDSIMPINKNEITKEMLNILRAENIHVEAGVMSFV